MRHTIRLILIAGTLGSLGACSGEAPAPQGVTEAAPAEPEEKTTEKTSTEPSAPDEDATASPEPAAVSTEAADSTAAATASAPAGADDVARAEAYVAASCLCLFDNYAPAGQPSSAQKICIDQANAKYAIPTDVSETFTVQVGPSKVTHPRLFKSEDANQAYAKAQQACMLRFTSALQKYQTQKWTDAICMKQCAEEGEAKVLCTKVCMDKRLPALPDSAAGSEGGAPEACEDKCATLNGRSKYACERKCKTE